jgi:hypothetical protein
MNWEALINKKIIAPFRPNINDQEDVKYFDDEFVELPLKSPEEYISESNMIYTNFSYNNVNISEKNSLNELI